MIFYVVVFGCLTIVGENKHGCPDDLCDDLLTDKERNMLIVIAVRSPSS